MKKVKIIILSAITLFVIHSCGNSSNTDSVDPSAGKHVDTINFMDANGLRQGLWDKFNDKNDLMSFKNEKDTGTTMVMPHDGRYKDGKKIGVWNYYHPDGSIRRVEFKNDVPLTK